jgi:hypothetical protein
LQKILQTFVVTLFNVEQFFYWLFLFKIYTSCKILWNLCKMIKLLILVFFQKQLQSQLFKNISGVLEIIIQTFPSDASSLYVSSDTS